MKDVFQTTGWYFLCTILEMVRAIDMQKAIPPAAKWRVLSLIRRKRGEN